MKSSRALRALLELVTVEATPGALLLALIVSSALGLGALALAVRIGVVALAVLLPWLPIIARKLRSDWATYSWLAFFELLVILQIGHFAEHVSQVIELHWLEWSPVLAHGIFGDLDIEPVHWWWNTSILFSATLLLLKFRRNRWLWASWIFSIWHELEHLYIYFWWFLPQGVSGHPGILGAGGLLDQANIFLPYLTTLSRADLHFWYNLFEIGLFVIAFGVQALGLVRVRPSIARGKLFSPRRALVFAASGQIAIITFLALARYSPPTLNVPQNYSTIQSAVDAAPDWAIIRIAPGDYREALSIRKPLTLVGGGRAETRLWQEDDKVPALAISSTHDVTIKNLAVNGGLYGIVLDESRAVRISNSAILSSWFVGIRVSRSAALIEQNEIVATRSPYGMGIELANCVQSAPTVIRNNIVRRHPHEGIVTHNSNALIERNTVEENGQRGIAVTEMSMATVRANQISSNRDAGIYVVDHSMAELDGNQVRDSRPGARGTADGIRGDYYAEIMLRANVIQAEPGREIVLVNGASLEPWR